jgi:hypothetical protein
MLDPREQSNRGIPSVTARISPIAEASARRGSPGDAIPARALRLRIAR